MELLNNIGGERLGDALAASLDEGVKLSIISSYFTVFAYGELKEELARVDEVRYLFSEPTFVRRMASNKDPREFEIAKSSREHGVGGVGLELTLRNNLNQRALARECAEWVRSKAQFRSAIRSGIIQSGGTYVVENPSGVDHGFMGSAANFTLEGLGYERRPDAVMPVSHFEGATEVAGLKAIFESVWNNPALVQDVTEEVAAQVGTLYRENPPEFVYFLTLYHLFRDYLADDDQRTTESFASSVNADYFKLLDIFTIARSRKHIAKYYGAQNGSFPARRAPISFTTKIDSKDALPPIGELNDMIAGLTFAQYQLLSYVRTERRQKYEDRYGDTWGKDYGSQVNRTHAVVGLMRVNLLKRMESSVNSFRLTLRHVLDGCEDTLRRLRAGEKGATSYSMEGLTDGLDDDDAVEFEAGGKVRVDLRDVDAVKLVPDLEYDITVLRKLLSYAEAVTPERDEKLARLREYIIEKAQNPFNEGNRKVLVFSAFSDTTDYLFDQLAPALKEELGLECAEVAGTVNRTYSLSLRRTNFENILSHFSPISKELPEAARALGEIDVVFATDCISEGQNLQDCDCLINYDIHWNPARIIQRFGRIDRLGSKNGEIQLVDFWPDVDLDEYIQLENRVKGRMVLLDASATGEENVLEAKSSSEMNDLKYRRQQLQQLRTEVLDLEDVSGGISITDLAFDDFRVELQRYVANNPGLLEAAPTGLHAVARIPEELREEVKPGVVFCLKQNDDSRDPGDNNPTFPYYVVYVASDGSAMSAHTQPKTALDIMRAASTGQTEPLAELCRAFNRETRDGERMGAYSELLDKVVAAIGGVQQDKGIESLFSLGEVGGGTSLGFDDYALVSFVVLR